MDRILLYSNQAHPNSWSLKGNQGSSSQIYCDKHRTNM